MRALIDVPQFIALASTLRSPKDRAEFVAGFIAGVSAEAWNDDTPIFSDAQALGITALGEARKRGVAQ